jgi:hypothetical protein
MEEEYRLHKTHASVDLTASGMGSKGEDTSSVTGMKSPPPQSDGEGSEPPSAIPTIRISTESARTPNPTQSKFPDRVSEEDEDEDSPARTEEIVEEEHVLEKPAVVHEKEDVSGAAGVSREGEEGVSAFSNKRLCERWLGESHLNVPSLLNDTDSADNLFL